MNKKRRRDEHDEQAKNQDVFEVIRSRDPRIAMLWQHQGNFPCGEAQSRLDTLLVEPIHSRLRTKFEAQNLGSRDREHGQRVFSSS
jgi:hypothetical protein